MAVARWRKTARLRWMRNVFVSSFMLLGFAGPGFGDSLSGGELLALCLTPKSGDMLYFTNFSLCAGYINGASDASQCGNSVGGFSHANPAGVTVGEVFDVFVRWMQAHPEQSSVGASTLVAKAMQDAYPCK